MKSMSSSKTFMVIFMMILSILLFTPQSSTLVNAEKWEQSPFLEHDASYYQIKINLDNWLDLEYGMAFDMRVTFSGLKVSSQNATQVIVSTNLEDGWRTFEIHNLSSKYRIEKFVTSIRNTYITFFVPVVEISSSVITYVDLWDINDTQKHYSFNFKDTAGIRLAQDYSMKFIDPSPQDPYDSINPTIALSYQNINREVYYQEKLWFMSNFTNANFSPFSLNPDIDRRCYYRRSLTDTPTWIRVQTERWLSPMTLLSFLFVDGIPQGSNLYIDCPGVHVEKWVFESPLASSWTLDVRPQVKGEYQWYSLSSRFVQPARGPAAIYLDDDATIIQPFTVDDEKILVETTFLPELANDVSMSFQFKLTNGIRLSARSDGKISYSATIQTNNGFTDVNGAVIPEYNSTTGIYKGVFSTHWDVLSPSPILDRKMTLYIPTQRKPSYQSINTRYQDLLNKDELSYVIKQTPTIIFQANYTIAQQLYTQESMLEGAISLSHSSSGHIINSQFPDYKHFALYIGRSKFNINTEMLISSNFTNLPSPFITSPQSHGPTPVNCEVYTSGYVQNKKIIGGLSYDGSITLKFNQTTYIPYGKSAVITCPQNPLNYTAIPFDNGNPVLYFNSTDRVEMAASMVLYPDGYDMDMYRDEEEYETLFDY